MLSHLNEGGQSHHDDIVRTVRDDMRDGNGSEWQWMRKRDIARHSGELGKERDITDRREDVIV